MAKNNDQTAYWLDQICPGPNALSFDKVPELVKTEEFCLAAVQQNGSDLKYVPNALRTEAICLAAVQQNGWALNYVPEPLKTESLYLAAVKQTGYVVTNVPEELQTEALLLAAVQHSAGRALKYVPKALITDAICRTAVKQDGYALKYVPNALKTYAICLAAVKSRGDALKYVPNAQKTEAMCLAALQRHGDVLQYVPKHLEAKMKEENLNNILPNRREKITKNNDNTNYWLEKIREDPKVLAFVPKELKTEAVCLAAMQKGCWIFKYVPEHIKAKMKEEYLNNILPNRRKKIVKNNDSTNFWLERIQLDPFVLQFVPEESKTEAMCLAAVQQHFRTLEYVPESLKTEAVYLAAVKIDGDALEYVPELQLTNAICLAAIQQKPRAFRYVPESLKTEDLYLAAVKQDGWVFKYVPESLKTEAVYLDTVKHNGLALGYVPELQRTEAICLAAVEQEGIALYYVPEPLRTELICVAAIQNDSWAFLFVPQSLLTVVKAQTKYGTFFDAQKIKELLIAIKEADVYFDVQIWDIRHPRERGVYSPFRKLITLYLFEYNSKNDLMSVAIHEYAHHILKEYSIKHETKFWICYFELLAIAEKKNFYSCNIDKSPKLKKITTIIKQNNLLQNGKIFKEGFEDIFYLIPKLCEETDIDFQHYTVKYLEMDWYKEEKPLLDYNKFYRKYIGYNRKSFPKDNYDDLLHDFF